MPMTIRNAEGPWIDTVCEGPIHHADIVAHIDAERSRGLLDRPELIDATGATAAFTADEARDLYELVHEIRETQGLGPVAVLVKDDLTYGMVRMLGMLVDRVTPVHPFRQRAAAINWLEARPGGR